MCPRPRAVSDDDVLAATARVISRVGPGELTIAAVAEEAGFAPSSLMQRFGSKRGLLLAFARQAPRGVEAVFAAARARHASPLDALQAALLMLPGPVRTRDELAHHLAFLQMDLSDPEFRVEAAAHGRAFRREAERLLEDAIGAGELTAGAPASMANVLQVVFNGVLVTWAIHGEGSLRRQVRRVLPIVLGADAHGAGARPGRGQPRHTRG